VHLAEVRLTGCRSGRRRLGPDRLRAARPGTGPGLSIVRAVAGAHGGDVEAVPRDVGGLTVTVTLPRA